MMVVRYSLLPCEFTGNAIVGAVLTICVRHIHINAVAPTSVLMLFQSAAPDT